MSEKGQLSSRVASIIAMAEGSVETRPSDRQAAYRLFQAGLIDPLPSNAEIVVADALRTAWAAYATTGDWYDSVGTLEMARVAVSALRAHTETAPPHRSTAGPSGATSPSSDASISR